MLEEIKSSYIQAASRIPGWQNESVNTLCNLYIDNEDNDLLKSAYFAAIILKKWPYIGKHYTSSKASGFSIEDCYEMVIHGIMYALEKRKWRDPTNKLYNDRCAPDKVLNRCIASSRDIQYYLSNTGKRKVNYGKASLDSICEEVNDCNELLADDDAYEEVVNDSYSIDSLTDNLINKNKIIEAMIVNSIVNDDCFIDKCNTETVTINKDTELEEEIKVKKHSSSFKAGKLVDNLYKYKSTKVMNLCANHKLNEQTISAIVQLFDKTDKNKFARIIKITLKNMAKDTDISKYLCL